MLVVSRVYMSPNSVFKALSMCSVYKALVLVVSWSVTATGTYPNSVFKAVTMCSVYKGLATC